MPRSFSLFLALKYMKPKRTFLSVISVISVVGVMLGVAMLVIVLSVMSGFDDMWRDKILGFDSHITVSRRGVIEDADRMAEMIQKVDGVSGVAPYVQGFVYVTHGQNYQIPMMRGVDVDKEKLVSQIPNHIVAGRFSLDEDEVVVGRDFAFRLGVTVGDKLLIYSPQSFMAGKDEAVLPLPEEVRVSGIFEIGMYEYDVGFILLPLSLVQDMFGLNGGVHALRVMTKDPDPYPAKQVAERIEAVVRGEYPDVVVKTWMELNQQFFDTLRLEKHMMFFMLIIIVLVAAFGITNTLIIVVVQKTREIGLLRAVGFSSGSIMRVFFWQGWIQGVIGTALGVGLGMLMLRYRNALMHGMSTLLGRDLFPRMFYQFSEIPARTSVSDIVVIVVLSMILCTLAGFLPAWRASRLDPARALRHE